MKQSQRDTNPAIVPDPGTAVPQSTGHQPGEERKRKHSLQAAVAIIVISVALEAGIGVWLWRGDSNITGASQSNTSSPQAPKSVPLPSGIQKGDLVSLDGALPPKRSSTGKLESGGVEFEQTSGPDQCDGLPQEGQQPSIRCIWEKVSTSTAWAP